MTVTDSEIPGRGFPFKLTRTYRSRRDGERSILGYNWQLNYDEYLTPGTYSENHHVYQAVQWTMGNGFTDVWVDRNDGFGYKPFQGFVGRIRQLASNQGYQIRYADGTVKTFGQSRLNAYADLLWVLTRIEDRNGNVLTLQISSAGEIQTITDTLGRKITFGYTHGRLTSVTDFQGRTVVYGYDEVRGNLSSVRSPVVTGTPNGNDFPGGKTISYRYLGEDGCTEDWMKHNLKSTTDGKGQTFLTNTYYSYADPLCGTPGLPVDAVASQVYGSGTPPPALSYTYNSVSTGQSPTANVVNSQATVIDRNGNVQVHNFNLQGNPLSIEHHTNRGVRSLGGGDEIDYVVTHTYVITNSGEQPMLVSRRTESGGYNVDSAGNLVSYAEGMTEEYEYYDQLGLLAHPDPFQKGNMIRATRTPGPRGAPAGQEQLVTQVEYEPLFNQPVQVTNPRGHVTRMTYDYQEGSYAQLSGGPTPAPVDPSWWDNNEISQFMTVTGNSSVGEINGDGYHRSGNLIKASEGVATDSSGAPSPPGAGDEIATTTAYNGFGLPTIQRDAEYNEVRFRYFAENDPDGDLTATPAPPDGRTLSNVTGSSGGGYLKEKVLDATPTMPLPPGVAANPRESGQNPTARNVLLSFTYDRMGNLKKATDGRGVLTEYTVNALNQIVQVVHAAVSTDSAVPPFGYLEQFAYDANNNVTQHRTERRDDGALTSPSPVRWITKGIAYDSLDREISETISTDDVPAISLTTSYAYDNNGNLRKTVFPAGNAILRFYDERDLLTREVVLKNASSDLTDMTYNASVDSVTQYDYDGSGNVIQLTDPEGHMARSGYDGYGRKVVGFDPAFQKTTLVYDQAGNVLSRVAYGALGGATPAPSIPPSTQYPELSRQNFYYDE
ncbi:MAG TPA: DUF6531 domain-containing protein, partial [Candidatus Polarisedimenticolia bacterium]|nr:DUF6531 domain-containing protein [Candidatus Polarisedimenticolia bacterium]